MRTWILVIVLGLARVAQADVLVEGEPPLTQDMVDRSCDLLEWAMDLQMTAEQRDHARDTLVASWKAKDHQAIANSTQLLALYDRVARLTPAQRDQARGKTTPELLAQLKKDRKDPLARWLLGVYDTAHAPIAQGDPPLTRQTIDACAELLKTSVEHELVARWPKLDHAQQQQLARLPAFWAAARVAWARASETERAAARKQWAEALHRQIAPQMTPLEFAQALNHIQMSYRMASEMVRISGELGLYAIGNIDGHSHYEWKWMQQ
jgi:hypothetical protein